MSRVNRLSSAVLGLMSFALLLIGCGDDTPSLTPSAEEAARILPEDAQLVTRMDFQALQAESALSLSSERGITIRLLDSDFTFNPLSAEAQARLDAFIEATGVDPTTDLESVFAALPSDSTAGSDRMPGFAIIADLDPDQLRSYLAEQTAVVSESAAYNDVTVYRMTNTPAAGLHFALLSDRLIAVTPTEAGLHRMIDRHQGNAPALADRAGGTRLFAESVREGPLGLVAYDLPTQRMLDTVEQVDGNRFARIGRAVRDVVATLDLQEDRVNGRLLLTTDQNASDLADVVRGAIAAVKTGGDLSETERAMLDRIEVSDRDDMVTVRFDMDLEQLARWMMGQERPART